MTIKEGSVLPGGTITISVKAARHSDVALLAVDKGLYILNNENKLTQDQVLSLHSNSYIILILTCKFQVFDEVSNFDKSCGYSGIDTRAVFDVY